jgi:hypothetical protein
MGVVLSDSRRLFARPSPLYRPILNGRLTMTTCRFDKHRHVLRREKSAYRNPATVTPEKGAA